MKFELVYCATCRVSSRVASDVKTPTCPKCGGPVRTCDREF